jgi:hypothetical protein
MIATLLRLMPHLALGHAVEFVSIECIHNIAYAADACGGG